VRAVRLREHRWILIWCGYREGEEEKHHGRNKNIGIHGEKKKNHFQSSSVRGGDKHRHSGYQAAGLGDNISGCVSRPVSWGKGGMVSPLVAGRCPGSKDHAMGHCLCFPLSMHQAGEWG